MNSERLSVTYGLVMRNAGLNLGGRALPAIVVVLTVPIILRGLGLERYGILSLALVIVTYAGLLDLGLGGATTKHVAEALGKGEFERLPTLIWTSLALIVAFGLFAGLLMLLGTPLLVDRFLRISPEFRAQAKTAFYVMSWAAPFMLLGSGLQGVLEAKQRYDLVNAVTIPSSIGNYVIPVAAIHLHAGLIPISAFLVVARAGTCLAFFLLCLKVCPELKESVRVSFKGTRPLLVFGAWLAVSNLAWPVLLYLDRLVLASVSPVAVLPFYVAPCDLVTRLWILPSSWAALYPAFSAIGQDRRDELASLCARGLKHLALLMGPIVIVAICFAGKILRLWLGDQFEIVSTAVFQILAAGILVNSLASVPDRLIKGIGRADIIAKLHVVQLPLYGVLLYTLVGKWGIVGAAVAWSARALAEAVIVFAISSRLIPTTGPAIVKSGMPRMAISLTALAAAMWMAVRFFAGLAQFALGAVFLAASAAFMWRCVFDCDDRESLRSALNLARSGA